MHLRHPLLRQFLGAIGGAAIALLLYEAYALAAPPLETALFHNSASSEAKMIKEETQSNRLDRIAALARENLAKLQGN